MKRLLILLCLTANAFAQPQPLAPVIDNSSYSRGSAYKSVPSPNQTLYETLNRLEQLQVEVQQLRGLVEEQSYTIQDLRKRQQNIYTDIDQRLLRLEGGKKTKPVSGATAQKQTPIIPSTPKKVPVAPAAPPAPVKPAKPTPAPAVKKKTVQTEKQMYQQAYEKLRNGHYTQAIILFKQLLAEYPSGEFADNSQYWLGETYKVNQDIKSARSAFTRLLKVYPNSVKVPDALLKLGYIEFEQKNWTAARDYLTMVTLRYPDTTAAHLATKKLQQLDNVKP
jgi:tol-pal system protein YbgF